MRRLALALALALCALPAPAQESRPFNPIPRPGQAASAAARVAPAPPAAVREAVMKTVNALAEAWNSPDLAKLLSPSFYDRQRLLDALATKVPRDARLRILEVQAIQVLGEFTRPGRDGGRDEVFTRVSVTLRTQVEFTDPVRGFQRLEGLNEAILAFPAASLR